MIDQIVRQWNTLLPGMLLLGLLPFLVIMLTSYLKIVVVLSILRNAIGIQQVPPGMVINGLALVLTIYIMSPVFADSYTALNASPKGKQASLMQVIDKARGPLGEFLYKYSDLEERRFFVHSAQEIWPKPRAEGLNDRNMLVLIPAFTVSELTEAFKIGFYIYLPFIVIDMVVTSVLLAMGMMMVSPMTISIPIKLLLIVLLNGWVKIVHALVLTYK